MKQETEKATDYTMSIQDAYELKGVTLLPHEFRKQLLRKYAKDHGRDALADLFSQFIGLANSVVANSHEALEMVAITEFGAEPRVAEQINFPSIFGALCGVSLAAGVNQEKTCHGCAFRIGSCANQSQITTCDADWCLDGDDRFMCHENLDVDEQPTKPCIGYQSQLAKRSD